MRKNVRFMYEVCTNAEAPSLSIIDCANTSVTSACTDMHERATSMNVPCLYVCVLFSFNHIAESSGASQVNTYEYIIVRNIVQDDTEYMHARRASVSVLPYCLDVML